MGLYKQGLLHDLSKYSPTEFLVGIRYYQGDRSPNNAEREIKGYSSSWLHHKGRNKHHYEYWIDYDREGNMVPCPMPKKYIAEMLMDRIAASKVYEGKKYTDASALRYYQLGGNEHSNIHPETKEILERMLIMLAEKGERETFACIREELTGKQSSR